MKSKYFFCAAAVAAVALTTGCSDDELVTETPVDAKPISFRVNGDAPQSRLKSTSTTLGYVNAFAVWGVDYNGTAVTNATLFDGVSVVRQVGAADNFDYSPKRMYSIGADVASFFAFSPISKFVTSPTLTTTSPGSFSLAYANQKPDATGNATQEDLLYASNLSVTTGTGTVALNFGHALSRIFVTATNSMTTIPVTIKSLTLKNLYNAGTFVFPFTPPALGWTTSGSVTDLPYVLAESGVAVEAGASTLLVTSKEQGMLIIPQATVNTGDDTAWDTGDFALEVVYDIANLTNKTAYICLLDGFAFEPGKQYQINIVFTGTEIKFTVDISAFTDGTVQPPTNNP